MIQNIKCINNFFPAISSDLLDEVSNRILKWSTENNIQNIPVIVTFDKFSSEDFYKFCWEKKIYESLKNGVCINLLRAAIDIKLRDLRKSEYDDIGIIIYMGFSEIPEKKITSKLTENKSLEFKTSESSCMKNTAENEEAKRISIKPVTPIFKLSQVILSEKTRTEIKTVITLLENMDKIYNEWGFIDVDPIPKSIVNFFGPPGTGKTMTVHAIADSLGKKILILNYADIESKYVGEAPKNLIAAFDIAAEEDAIIFFDEADSFLGKRITNVDSGHDQAINSLRSQMLMKLEEFKGIVFFATNLHDNYDRAFDSRILKHIEFTLPDKTGRKQIIKSKLPSKAPYECDLFNENSKEIKDEILDELAEIIDGFSGREIKNCILEVLVEAAAKESPVITHEIMVSAFKKKKEEFDKLKKRPTERKQEAGKIIASNLSTGNYKTVKMYNKKKKRR